MGRRLKYGAPRPKMGLSRPIKSEDGGGRGLDAADPRLVSVTQERREAKVRDELSGEADRRARGKVSLPTLKFMSKED